MEEAKEIADSKQAIWNTVAVLATNIILAVFALGYILVMTIFGYPGWLAYLSVFAFWLLILTSNALRNFHVLPQNRLKTFALLFTFLVVFGAATPVTIAQIRQSVAMLKYPPFPGATLQRISYNHSSPLNEATTSLVYALPNAESRKQELWTFYRQGAPPSTLERLYDAVFQNDNFEDYFPKRARTLIIFQKEDPNEFFINIKYF